MPTLLQPEPLPGPFAYNGDKNDIPDASASLGAASYQQGFPPITQLPVNAGGIPPQRNDFNGILNALSQHTFWQQSGGMYAWSATLDYAIPSMVVGSDKEIYFALQPSGPGTAAGAKNPTSGGGKAYWQNIAYVLPVATATKLGGVMVNKGGLQVSASGLLSLLLMQGGGLNLNATGQLYVDTADFSDEMLRAFLEGIIADGGGLGFDSSGKLYVDADAFSEDLLEKFLKSIRVPIWLNSTLNMYVNGTTGSDTTGDGTAAKPFATISKAVRTVCDNYNLSSYAAIVRVAPGVYDEDVEMYAYSSSGGYIRIQGDAGTHPVLRGSLYARRTTGTWYVDGLDISFAGRTTPNATSYAAVRVDTSILVNLLNCAIDLGTGESAIARLAVGGGEGSVILRQGCSITGKCGSCLLASGCVVQIFADLSLDGVEADTVAQASSLGRIMTSKTANGCIMPVISGTVSGRRYVASTNGIINVEGAGPDYFPGTIAGTVSTGGQYV